MGTARVALATGRAFTFGYPDNIEALAAAGADVVEFDPLTTPALPADVNGVVVGGGFPEVYVRELAANQPLLRDVRRRINAGLVVWAECAGLLWLGQTLDDLAMVGALQTHARMTDQLTLGYRSATLRRACPLGPIGTSLRGHEFHYSALDVPGDGIELSSSRNAETRAGYATPTLLASYLHIHLGGHPAAAESFVSACTSSDEPPRPTG
jgi:cobyrinic acid a,c-diamide synthase